MAGIHVRLNTMDPTIVPLTAPNAGATAAPPRTLIEWLAFAERALAADDAASAESAFAQALELAPNDRRVLDGLARAAAALGRADGEIWALRRIAELAPDDAIAHAELGDALRRADRNDEAAGALFLAKTRAPRDRQIRWLAWHTLPIVHADRASFDRARTLWDQELGAFEAELAERPPTPAEGLALLTGATNFHRHYLGDPLVELQRRYGALLGTLARAAFPGFDAPLRGSGAKRRRIGFVSAHLREHTVLKIFARWMTDLDPARFERIVFALEPRRDAWTDRLEAGVDRYVAAPERIEALPATIRDAKLDVLVHLDVGMHPYSQLLAPLRLAPLQINTWGHPITSGCAALDAYVSGAAMEPPDGAQRYSERLIALPNLGSDYDRPADPSDYRVALPDASLAGYFFCPQSAHKLHPGHDTVYAEILARCPRHALVLVPHPKAEVRERLERRLAKALRARGVDPARRLVVLPALPYRDFLAVARHAALLVDSFDWSGFNTSIESLGAGTPIVTLPGDTMRARHTAAMLGLLELPELVVRDVESYIATVCAIASDPERRRALSTTISERSDALFRDPAVLPALTEVLA